MRYLDTSAFLKLLVAEDHSDELRSDLAGRDDLWSSTMLDVEAHRAAPRLLLDEHALVEALEAVTLVVPGETTFATARRVGLPALRILDAVHLATALELGPDLEQVITYDRRLATGCDGAALSVHAPGLPAGWWLE